MLGMTILYLHTDEENMKNRREVNREKKRIPLTFKHGNPSLHIFGMS